MSPDVAPSLLELVVSRTLEEAAFVFCERSDAPADVEEPLIEAALTIAGDHAGELRLVVSETFASTLAANMLGEEEGGAAVTGDDEDAVGELLNMIAGAAALEMFGRYARCTLGVPRVRRVSASAHREALAAADSLATLVDGEGQRIDVSLLCGRGGRR